MDVGRRAWIWFAAFAVATLAFAPVAHAAFGFQDLASGPAHANAGANSDVDIHIGFTSPGDNVKDLTVGLPPGLVGNPTATPLCTVSQLQSDTCPGASQVGTLTTAVTAHVLLLSLPLTVDGSLYNLERAAGEPARFGIVLRPVGSDPIPLLEKIKQVSDVRPRSRDFGLDTVLTDVPRVAHAVDGVLSVPIDINSIDIHLDGVVGGQGFMRNPTSCGRKKTTFTADSYAHPDQDVTGVAFYRSTRCAALPFHPTVSATLGSPGHTAAFTKPPLTTVIRQQADEAGLKTAQLILPLGTLTGNANLFDSACKLAQFRADASACPALSIVGSATAVSPDVPADETEAVVLVRHAKGAFLPRLGPDLHGPLALQLLGSFVVTQDGIGNAFTKLPDIPITRFQLDFKQDGLIIASTDLYHQPPPPLTFPTALERWNGATETPVVVGTVNGCP